MVKNTIFSKHFGNQNCLIFSICFKIHSESDTTEQLHFYFSLSCIGEGNGNPLQCSCLENPRDGGAWWAAVYGVTQSQTWLKWLSSAITVKKQRCNAMQRCKQLSLGSFSWPLWVLKTLLISICFKLRKMTIQITYHLSECYIFIKILL